MNFIRKAQQNSNGTNGTNSSSSMSSTSSISISSTNLKNISPNTNSNLSSSKPKPFLNLIPNSSTNSSTTLLSLNTPTPQSNSPLPANNNVNNNNNSSNNQNNFVLPSINPNHSRHSSNSDTFSRSFLNLNVSNLNSNNNNNNSNNNNNNNNNSNNISSSSFSDPMSSIKNNIIRNKLGDAKAFLEIELEQSKINLEQPLANLNINQGTNYKNSRPSVLTPINPSSVNCLTPIPVTTPRMNRPNLKIDLNTPTPRPSQFEVNFNGGTNKVKFSLGDSSTPNSSDTPLSLNIPSSSSRSSSASSVSLSSSTSSLAATNAIQLGRLEAANSDKFKEIILNAGYLLINKERIRTTMDDLSTICELGSGTCGYVIKMKHNPTGYAMAVKQMSISGIIEENKRIIMDLDVVVKSHDCKYIVRCLGYFISESDVWICMELMSMCFDKLLKRSKVPIPESILGKLTVSTINALNYLKEQHNVIHRDIKPSNILIDENGEIKLCDFGISGNLINSNAHSRNNTGCAGYMAPERIDPADSANPVYDIRADVWSLGITLVELATGNFPYKNCNNEFEVMSTIVAHEAPKLEGEQFTDMFKSFVNQCLTKDVNNRPKYNVLLKHPFVKYYTETDVDVKSWLKSVIGSNEQMNSNSTNDLSSISSNGSQLHLDESRSEISTPVDE